MDIEALIESLRSLDLKLYPLQEVQDKLLKLQKYALAVTTFHAGNVVFRVRPNVKCVSFTSPSDLSYKPQCYNDSFQRASSPSNTMFYGSIIPEDNIYSELDTARVIAATEGSNLIRNNIDGSETVSFGKWRITDSIHLCNIISSVDARNTSPYTKKRAAFWNENVGMDSENVENQKRIMDFLASEFAKKAITGDYDYIISALFTELILIHGLDGVIYPSVRADEKGMNVAIHPEIVNTKMRLEGVMECIITKQGSNVTIDNSRIAWVNPGQNVLKFIPMEDELNSKGITIDQILRK